MPRKLEEIIAHIRAVSANPSVSTTLIQTEDLEALCDAAERQNGRPTMTAGQKPGNPIHIIAAVERSADEDAEFCVGSALAVTVVKELDRAGYEIVPKTPQR
jgi:hypothetical protein